MENESIDSKKQNQHVPKLRNLRLWLAFAAVAAITAAAALCFININKDKKNTEETKRNGIETVDTDSFLEIPLQEYEINLTDDGVPDIVQVYLLGDESDDIAQAEDLVNMHARSIVVRIKDGNSGDNLYEKRFSHDRIGNGQLAIVKRGSLYYIFESDINQQYGEADYSAEVFYWQHGEKVTVDSAEAYFVCEPEGLERALENEYEVAFRDEAVPVFRAMAERWTRGSEMLVSCDLINYFYGEKEVYISMPEQSYSLNDYFDAVWNRADTELTEQKDDLYLSHEREFWRQQIGDYTISLRGYDQDGNCGLYLASEDENVLLKTLEGKGEDWSVSLFSDILAHDGFILMQDCGYYKSWTYYTLNEDGALIYLAYSWGDAPENNDYAVDVDGDQDKELICNVQYMADGVLAVLFYDWQQDKVMEGDVSVLGDEPKQGYSLGNPYFQYNPETGMLEGFYYMENIEDFEKREYRLDMNKIQFYDMRY